MLELVAVIVVALLAYANGANDNFKGVATLFGSGLTAYRRALLWATGTTLLGSLAALFIAQELLVAFTGKGLVPQAVVATPEFALAVAIAAGATVLLATRLGFPVSTTHALVGGLVGAGAMAAGDELALGRAARTFFLPLAASPVLAIASAMMLYPLAHWTRRRLGLREDTCVCIGNRVVETVPAGVDATSALERLRTQAEPTIGREPYCRTRYDGRVLGLSAGVAIDRLHYASAGAVSFARGLNDTPKIAALLLVGAALSPGTGIILVAAFMVLGALLSARRVAETMSLRVTSMNPGQGLVANLVTAGLVIGASRFGLPVSTTHVSCGSLFGIGAVTGGARWRTIVAILTAWVTTLPLAAALGVVASVALRMAAPP